MPGCAVHVHVTATRASTRDRPQGRQGPLLSAITVVGIGHIQDVSSRTGTRLILQIGHAPGLDSITSGCMGHVIDSGGSFPPPACGVAWPPRCADTPPASTRTRNVTAPS